MNKYLYVFTICVYSDRIGVQNIHAKLYTSNI